MADLFPQTLMHGLAVRLCLCPKSTSLTIPSVPGKDPFIDKAYNTVTPNSDEKVLSKINKLQE